MIAPSNSAANRRQNESKLFLRVSGMSECSRDRFPTTRFGRRFSSTSCCANTAAAQPASIVSRAVQSAVERPSCANICIITEWVDILFGVHLCPYIVPFTKASSQQVYLTHGNKEFGFIVKRAVGSPAQFGHVLILHDIVPRLGCLLLQLLGVEPSHLFSGGIAGKGDTMPLKFVSQSIRAGVHCQRPPKKTRRRRPECSAHWT